MIRRHRHPKTLYVHWSATHVHLNAIVERILSFSSEYWIAQLQFYQNWDLIDGPLPRFQKLNLLAGHYSERLQSNVFLFFNISRKKNKDVSLIRKEQWNTSIKFGKFAHNKFHVATIHIRLCIPWVVGN